MTSPNICVFDNKKQKNHFHALKHYFILGDTLYMRAENRCRLKQHQKKIKITTILSLRLIFVIIAVLNLPGEVVVSNQGFRKKNSKILTNPVFLGMPFVFLHHSHKTSFFQHFLAYNRIFEHFLINLKFFPKKFIKLLPNIFHIKKFVIEIMD